MDAPDEGGADYGTLRIPVVGTSLGCEGRSNARVVVGVAGREGEGVLPPSPALSSLRLHLSVPGRAAHGGLVDGVVLTIRNAGTAPVRLDPCPYLALVTDAHGVSGTEEDGSSLLLPCDRASVVAGGDEARFALPPLQYGEGAPTGHGGLRTGERVTINVAIASLPTASATTQVD
ncbi:MAG TPA: hypothetical protein VFH54_08830 [Mycobacteriales bacterium]|nr:hypothetical protein [Mycobacteriales bacterium]